MLDSVFIGHMIGIMKTSYPDLQRKAASILEFITIIDPSMDTLISADIESGLDAIFQQKALEGMGTISFVVRLSLSYIVKPSDLSLTMFVPWRYRAGMDGMLALSSKNCRLIIKYIGWSLSLPFDHSYFFIWQKILILVFVANTVGELEQHNEIWVHCY